MNKTQLVEIDQLVILHMREKRAMKVLSMEMDNVMLSYPEYSREEREQDPAHGD